MLGKHDPLLVRNAENCAELSRISARRGRKYRAVVASAGETPPEVTARAGLNRTTSADLPCCSHACPRGLGGLHFCLGLPFTAVPQHTPEPRPCTSDVLYSALVYLQECVEKLFRMFRNVGQHFPVFEGPFKKLISCYLGSRYSIERSDLATDNIWDLLHPPALKLSKLRAAVSTESLLKARVCVIIGLK